MNLVCTRPGCLIWDYPVPEPLHQDTLGICQGARYSACGMPLVLNDRFFPYQVLGKGGFAATYLAIDGADAHLRPCVVKQLQPNPRFDAAQLEMAQTLFRREAHALSEFGLGHPQIPQLYDFFPLVVADPPPIQEFFYLAQEWIPGQTLSDILKNQGPLSVPLVVEMFEQVLEILNYVHQHHSIHRDIKPSNLMYHPSGKIYLLDFGAVKHISQTGGDMPDWSASIYSPGYAPPEQMSGGMVYPATDLYGLGVTCVVLLTGENPRKLFNSYNQSWHYRDYVRLSDALAALFDRCLAPAPSDRFSSASETLHALKRHDRPALIDGSCSWEPKPPEARSVWDRAKISGATKSPFTLTFAEQENPPGNDDDTGFLHGGLA